MENEAREELEGKNNTLDTPKIIMARDDSVNLSVRRGCCLISYVRPFRKNKYCDYK